jgi:hypothetical protein
LAIDALNLAESVDSALYVSDELRQAGGAGGSGGRHASRPAAR